MQAKQVSKKILILLSILALAVLVSYYFVYTDIKRKNENISKLSQDLEYQIKRRQYIVSLQRTLQSTDSDITRINNSIVPVDGDVEFIEDLERMARENGLFIGIDSLIFEESPLFASSTINILKIKAKTSGSWPSTYRFLAQIESLPFKVKVNNFGLGSSVQDTGSASKPTNSWQSTFEIHVLKYK